MLSLSQVYSVRSLANFSWETDDDASLLATSDIFQFENAAATYFNELLVAWLDEQEPKLHDPLTTKVAMSDQIAFLTPTGERVGFHLTSIVDFAYVGEEEIPTIASTLTNLTTGQSGSPTAAYANLLDLSGALPLSSFTMMFSDPPTDPSTMLYSVERDDSFSFNVGLIIACTLASIALFTAALVLLWAIGAFDSCKPCKNLRARFYMPSPRARSPATPYGVKNLKTKSTADETVDGHVGANRRVGHDEANAVPNQGFEVTPQRGIYRVDEEMGPLSAGSEMSDFTNCTEELELAKPYPLGISSIRKMKALMSLGTSPNTSACMSPQSILKDIKSLPVDDLD